MRPSTNHETVLYACEFCGHSVAGSDAFCPSCEAVQPLRGDEDYFTVMGVPRSPDFDTKQGEERFYELSRRLHPDRYTRKPGQLENAMHRSALVNDAYRTLRNPDSRLDYLLVLEGKELGLEAGKTAAKGQVPAELAEDYFELQEALMEGGVEAKAALQAFETRLAVSETGNQEAVDRVVRRWHEHGLHDPDRRAGALDLRKSIHAELAQIRQVRQYLYRMREDIARLTQKAG